MKIVRVRNVHRLFDLFKIDETGQPISNLLTTQKVVVLDDGSAMPIDTFNCAATAEANLACSVQVFSSRFYNASNARAARTTSTTFTTERVTYLVICNSQEAKKLVICLPIFVKG